MRETPFENIDAFIAEMDRTDDVVQLLSVLETQVQRLGFQRFTYWLLWPPEGPRVPLWLTNYPAEWTLHYNRLDLKSHDIIASRSAASFRPFLWSSLNRDALTKVQKSVFDDAIGFGLSAGGNIPIHGPGNAKATFTVSNDCSDREFEKLFVARRHELRLIATYTHERILELDLAKAPAGRKRLTPREIDVLAWSAKGKTRWEIGEILDVSEDTVKKHLVNATRKLGTTNKTHAIAAAIVHGLVIP